jgi:uncharacterized protein
MLVELFGKNFGCFRDEFRLSMLAADIDPGSNYGIIEAKLAKSDKPLRLLRCAAIYGPNASGKSTLMRAARVLWRILRQQATSGYDIGSLALRRFGLDANSDPVCLGVTAVFDGSVYTYEIAIHPRSSGSNVAIASEELLVDSDDEERVLFKRSGQQVEGEWLADARFASLVTQFRSDLSVLAIAEAFAPDLSGHIANGLAQAVGGLHSAHDPQRRGQFSTSAIARRAGISPEFRQWLRDLLSTADVGIADVRVVEKPGAVFTSSAEDLPLVGLELLGSLPEPNGFEFRFAHANSHEFSIDHESNGTRQLIHLSTGFYDLIHENSGSTWRVDELDNSLHPLLLETLIRRLNLAAPNQGRQLVFTTHETRLMDGDAITAALRRDQVYFVEKGQDGAAKLFSLADFSERQNLNYRKRYLEGRYGGVPILPTPLAD